MASMRVLDKTTNKYATIKIDTADLERLQKYNYIIDQHHTKPFREEKIDRYIRRIFLARDVMGFKFGDNRVVSYRNGDIYDVRKENLVEGRTRMKEVSSTEHFWPHTFKSLVNFLDKRKGEDEEVSVNFLLKATQVRYTRKRIDLVFENNDYNEYKSKGVQIILMRVLNKYFEWGGQVVVAKDLTEQEKAQIQAKEEAKAKKAKAEAEAKVKKLEREMKEDKNERNEVNEVSDLVKTTVVENNVWDKAEGFLKKDKEQSKSKLIELVSKYLPIENLIEIVMEKGSTSKMALIIQFVRKV